MEDSRGPCRMAPVTFCPSCTRLSSHTAEVDCQVPDTSTVTSVRSIQSFCAQPALVASNVAKTSPARVFIASPSWRSRARGWIDASERELLLTKVRHQAGHLVSADRQLTFHSASRVIEAEHISGHGAVDRAARATSRERIHP